MAHGKQTKGECIYCHRELTRVGLTKHFQSCKKREEAISAADATSGKNEILYHLLVQDHWNSAFWLHLEMSGSSTLEDLDHYLRVIWLECCGHMSQFSHDLRDGEEISMDTKIGKIFEKDVELCHLYDFGTTSQTLVKCVATRKGKPTTPHPIALMARNHLPEAYCRECDKPATKLCLECMYEGEDGMLCDVHAASHSCSEYGDPISIVNSPRLGMCGYDGPATPPY